MFAIYSCSSLPSSSRPARHASSLALGLAGLALLAWLVTAIPAIAVMTFTLTPLLRRVPALSTAEASNAKSA